MSEGPINMHEAKTQLSRLVERAVQGETIVIARGGKPAAQLSALSRAKAAAPKRIGFLAGQLKVPDDFDRLAEAQIAALFGQA